MSLKIRSLADGLIGTPAQGETTVNLVPAVATGKALIVKTMRFVNTHTASVTLNVYFKNSTARFLLPKDLLLPPGFCLIDDQEITLEAGDKIEGSSSIGDKVDFVISGAEREQS